MIKKQQEQYMIHRIHGLVWGPLLLGLLLLTGVVLTAESEGFQFWGIENMVGRYGGKSV